jgi:hypothetical protein
MTRFNQIKEMDLNDLAVFCSFNFNCDVCEAKTKTCAEDCMMCIDAIKDWLASEGEV